MASLVVTSIGQTGFQWYITGLGNTWRSSNYLKAGIGPTPVADGQASAPVQWSSVWPPTSGNSYSTPWETASGFSPGQTYTAYAFAQAANGLWYNAGSSTFTMQRARPSNFSWWSAKEKGGDFYVSAGEWNALASSINAFRSYKGLGIYYFTTAYSGVIYEAFYFNQAVSAISAMNPPMAPPGTVYSGQTIYASQLNGLVSSLNSIY
ncbi:hypothetical protein [Paenibacillus sp. YN15]|uniref:hypothetical protein n=1 Tax=Paenibacillus sp. YN15 TaxID=1742774 RepID=UPI0011BE7DCE|nr:hypothetical protein [Paenibacillus sp. YN15]